jgi:hypothetical protein
MFTVYMPDAEGGLRVAITVRAHSGPAAYDKAMELTGIAGAGAKVTRVTPGPGYFTHNPDMRGLREVH